ncbi:MAG: NnrS family protein [Venatoribacter sp.]
MNESNPHEQERVANPPFANIYWFPLAALYAALILPLSVGGQLGWFSVPAGLQTPWGHGHEMIFGFALAVIAGYVSGPMPKKDTATWVAMWLAARLSFWFFPTFIITSLLNLAFVALLVRKLAPIFLKTAKKWRNKSVGYILIGLLISALGFHLVQFVHNPLIPAKLTGHKMLLEAVLLLSSLMFYMGGRIIAPAMAGHFNRNNNFMKDRVQPRFEGSMLILLFTVLVLNLTTFAWADKLNAVLLLVTALLGCVRILRWRPWWCHDRADLLLLLLGYSWIKVGWVFVAISLWEPSFSITQALHAITVGALGTLTFTVMARARAHRVLRDPNAKPWFFVIPLLLSAAAVLRLTATHWDYAQAMLIAVTLWSVSFLSLLVWLLWLRKVELEKKKLNS